ncbi:SpoIIE family protein phosphatase [Telmatobacter sp. DSM 110680]|uniref:SpoIIE family protein phosphatase n=1 Tax=Telmatobacter sp. DSM 110680 TaxID=3036704 RepID=A0AAU7DN37_9BACT
MPSVTLKALLNPRSGSFPAFRTLWETMGDGTCIFDTAGKVYFGEQTAAADEHKTPIEVGDTNIGFVTGPSAAANALAQMLAHLAARESEGRSLASEVLHLYREVHLIEQLSEQLAALLNLSSVSQSALAQAQRLIHATSGCILVTEKADGPLYLAASFGPTGADGIENPGPLGINSLFAASVLERGIAEIVNDCASDTRALGSERELKALICAPLRSGQRSVGIIALATSSSSSYSTADLKLLNTIALQTGAAIANALLCAEMVDAARARAAFAAELQAASTVQQLLLQSASSPTPGFQVDSVYLPASEVGGDFFFVSPAQDGSLTAIVGDVSGKGLTAAMRVAMILGVLRRETSHDPGDILFSLNNALIAQGQLGFTTACCVSISLSAEYTIANAGHIAPYLLGHELETEPSLPLGIESHQTYKLVHGRLAPGERLVLFSDGVPEARSKSGELYGFERLAGLTLMPAQEIAGTAQQFGQEDDITVLTLGLAAD